jgi:hypothetical protein
LDPTAAGARVRRGPRRELGSRVHGGPPLKREGVCDLSRPREISRPWTRVSEGRRRARRSAVSRGGGFAGAALSRCTGRQNVRARALHEAEEHVSKPRGSGG